MFLFKVISAFTRAFSACFLLYSCFVNQISMLWVIGTARWFYQRPCKASAIFWHFLRYSVKVSNNMPHKPPSEAITCSSGPPCVRGIPRHPVVPTSFRFPFGVVSPQGFSKSFPILIVHEAAQRFMGGEVTMWLNAASPSNVPFRNKSCRMCNAASKAPTLYPQWGAWPDSPSRGNMQKRRKWSFWFPVPPFYFFIIHGTAFFIYFHKKGLYSFPE